MDIIYKVTVAILFIALLISTIGGASIGHALDKCLTLIRNNHTQADLQFKHFTACKDLSFKIIGDDGEEVSCPKYDVNLCEGYNTSTEDKILVMPGPDSDTFSVKVKNTVLETSGAYNVTISYQDISIEIYFQEKCLTLTRNDRTQAYLQFKNFATCKARSFKIYGDDDEEISCSKQNVTLCEGYSGEDKIRVMPGPNSDTFSITLKNTVGTYNVTVSYQDIFIGIPFYFQDLKPVATTPLTSRNTSNSFPIANIPTTRNDEVPSMSSSSTYAILIVPVVSIVLYMVIVPVVLISDCRTNCGIWTQLK